MRRSVKLLNRNYLPYHELIGLRVKVLSHADPTLVGRSGVVVDETMNTLVVEDEARNGRIVVLKQYGVFEFQLPTGERVVIDGTLIHGRPEDRLKKIQK